MKCFKFNRLCLLTKATYLENKRSFYSILGIYTLCVIGMSIYLSINEVLIQIDQRNLNVFDLTRDMAEGVSLYNIWSYFAFVIFGIVILVGIIMDKQMKMIRKREAQNYKILLPATVCEKFTTYILTTVIIPFILLASATIVSFYICKAFMWLTYSVTIAAQMDLYGAFDYYSFAIIAIWLLTLLAIQVIVSIYNSTSKRAYVSYLRVIITMIIVIWGSDLMLGANVDVKRVFVWTLYPAITLATWAFSYRVFKKKDIKN